MTHAARLQDTSSLSPLGDNAESDLIIIYRQGSGMLVPRRMLEQELSLSLPPLEINR